MEGKREKEILVDFFFLKRTKRKRKNIFRKFWSKKKPKGFFSSGSFYL